MGAHRNSAPTRRDLLRLGALAAVGTGFGTCCDLDRILAAAGSTPRKDYRALVCVFLAGGSDSHNLLVPRSKLEYGQYAANRSNLALPLESLLPIDPLHSDGIDYGLAPQLESSQTLFGEGKLAILRNVGALVEPVTKQSYLDKSVALPPQLFSHKDQQHYWHTALPDPGGKVGWAGRMSDHVFQGNPTPILTNVSLAGANLLQVGNQTSYYAMGAEGPQALSGFDGQNGFLRKLAFEALLGLESDSPFVRSYAQLQVEAAQIEGVLSAAFAASKPLATQFPDSPLGAQLRRVVQSIAIAPGLALERQVFFCQKGAFDNHSNLIEEYPNLLADLDACLFAFQRALEELGLEERVVLFTASDFGRSLSSNGKGSDHGWGGHQLVLGAPVAGGDLYGTMPVLDLDGPDDVGAGRLLPSTSIDQYGATLARWFGVAEPELPAVFPNLRSFARQDLGFLGV